MGVGDIISEARYNQLQGRISSLLGIGSGDKGYNQSVACNPVSVGSTVQVTDMNNMHTDFQKVYVHVNNQSSGTINTVATSNEIADVLFTAYETLITELEDDRFICSSGQAEIESAGVTSIRNGATNPWGGTSQPQSINHTIKVSFTSAAARRGFFNAGGQIRFDSTINISAVPADTNLQKNEDWLDI